MTRRLAGAVAAAALVLAGTLALPVGASPAAPRTTAAPTAPTGGDAPRLTLLGQPVAVAPNGTFTAFLAADDAPTATSIAVDIYPRVEPGQVVGLEPIDDDEATFPVVELSTERPTRTRNTGFTIHLFTDDQPNPDPAWGYQIDEAGVYPLRIRLRDPDGTTLSTLMTSIIRLPGRGETVDRAQAALLVPVHRPPPADPEERAAGNVADETLFEELDPVLDQLRDHPGLPATFSVTPDTLDRIAADPDATAELARLRTAVGREGQTLLDAPYVDIDAASLVDADLADTLSLERDLGRQTLRALLQDPDVGTWQLHDRVDAATLDELHVRGITRTVLPGDALEGGAGVLAPVELETGTGDLRAVAASDAYDLGLQATGDPVLAAHRLLARLAAAGPGPTGSAGIVVGVDPATTSEESLQIVADALTFGTPFFEAAGVDDLLTAEPAPIQARLTTPPDVDLGSYPADLRRSQSSLASYLSMVGGRTEQIRPYERTLAISAAEDLDLDERERDASSVDEALQVPFTSIAIPAKDTVTLGADDATFPLPIESDLEYPVKVVIELDATDRVQFPRNRIETDLPPGRTVLDIRVRTRTAGDTPVRITVRSPDDGVILAESQYNVRSTAVSGVGVILTVGAAMFLALWWGRHWWRNRGTPRHAKRRTHHPRHPDGTIVVGAELDPLEADDPDSLFEPSTGEIPAQAPAPADQPDQAEV